MEALAKRYRAGDVGGRAADVGGEWAHASPTRITLYLGGLGWLVEPGDPVRLGSAITRLLEDHLLAPPLGAGARVRAAQLSPGRVAQRLDVLYDEVVAKVRLG